MSFLFSLNFLENCAGLLVTNRSFFFFFIENDSYFHLRRIVSLKIECWVVLYITWKAFIVWFPWFLKRHQFSLVSLFFCIWCLSLALSSLHFCSLAMMWKILKEMGIPDHLTCLLRNLYAGQEATVRIGHETTDCFQIGKGVRQGCILSPYLLTSMQKRWAGRSTSWNQDCQEKY